MQSVYSNIVIKLLSQKQGLIEKATLYDIEVATPYNRWFLSKKYQDFEQLNSNLENFYHSLPQFPEDSILDMVISHFTDQKDDKIQKLQEYLQSLVIRKDILASAFLIEFLQMNRNSPQLIAASPMLLGEFSIDKDGDYPSKGIRDFYYDQQHRTFMILTADMNALSRANSFLINTKLPWQDNSLPTLLQVGSVQCWKIMGSQDNHQYRKIWTKIYPSQAIVIQYSKSKERLYVGLDNGQIDELKVSPSDGYARIQGVRSLQVHEERVTGMYLDCLVGVMYSISEDGFLHSVDMQNCFKIMSIPHDIPLSCIIADQVNKRLFIGADEGQIFVYDISTKGFPKLLISILTPQQGPIKSLALDLVKNYLFSAGFQNGLIAVFDLDKPGREKYTKQIAILQGKQNPRRLVWAPDRMEIMVGMGDGTVCFWNSLSGEAVYLLHAHLEQISKMLYDPVKRLLITSSKGQQMKFWSVPHHWRDIKNIQMQQDKIQERRKVDNALKIKQKVRRIAQNSDDDDLILWYRTPSVSDEESQQFF